MSVIEELGPGGMSSDETDDEQVSGGNSVKRLRRISIVWVNPELSKLFEAVDSYKCDPLGGFPDMNIQDKRGNRSHPRNYDALHKNISQKPIRGLPVNYYDPDWWVKNPRDKQNILDAEAERALPQLVSNFHPVW